MLASKWPYSIGTNLWPLESEKLRIFRYNPWQVWKTELSCMWKNSVLIVSVIFSLCPSSLHWGELVVPARNHIPVTDVPGRNVAVQGAWIEEDGRGIEECGESDGQEGEYKGRGLDPTVCVIKDCSVLSDITRRLPWQCAFFSYTSLPHNTTG